MLLFIFLVCAVNIAIGINPKPNIVLIMMDDLGFVEHRYNGGIYNTPTLNELATNGKRVNYHYANPICSASRTSLLTGRYSWNAGVPGLIYQQTTQHVDTDLLFLSDVLKMNNYNTAMFGKWHLGYSSAAYLPFNRGFDKTIFYESGASTYSTHLNCESWEIVESVIDTQFGDALQQQLETTFSAGFCSYDLWDEQYHKIENQIYSETFFTDNIVSYIDEYADTNNPMFIYYAMQTPHWPFESTPKSYTQCEDMDIIGDRKPFCNALYYGDEMIENIIQSLKRKELFENTVLIFLSDNGPNPNWQNSINLPKGYGQTLPLRGAKGSTFEGGIRTPAIVYGGFVDKHCDRKHGEYNQMMHISDWWSTIIHGVAGIPLDDFDDGDSNNLWLGICGIDGSDIDMDEYGVDGRDEIIHFEMNDVNEIDEGYKASYIRTNDWKLVVNASVSFVEFVSNKYWVKYDNSYSMTPPQEIYENMKGSGLYDLVGSACFDDHILNGLVDEEVFEYDEIMLFKISTDKIEACNVANVYPDIVDSLLQRLFSKANIDKYIEMNSDEIIELDKQGTLAQIESYDCETQKTYHLSWQQMAEYSKESNNEQELSWPDIFQSYIDIVDACNSKQISTKRYFTFSLLSISMVGIITVGIIMLCFFWVKFKTRRKEQNKYVDASDLTPLISSSSSKL